MTLPDSIIEQVGPTVESVAAQISRFYYRFGGTQDELAGQGWLWVAEHPKKMAEWFDPDITSPREGEKLLARTLQRELRNYGEDLKAQSLGYSRDDLAYYSEALLEQLLPKMFDIDAWIYPEQSEEGRRAKGDPAAGGNWVAQLADVAQAYAKLDKWDREILARFHQDGMTNNEMAEECGVSKQRMSEWHHKSLRRLVNKLGGSRPHAQHGVDRDGNDFGCEHGSWGVGRVAVSNAAARAYQQSAYEDE